MQLWYSAVLFVCHSYLVIRNGPIVVCEIHFAFYEIGSFVGLEGAQNDLV